MTPDADTPVCSHLDQVREVSPDSIDGCPACLAQGSTWVHLRECQSCGSVGCCDSSPNKHASAHHRATGHPVIRSFEPGETWWWCYEDQVAFEVQRVPPERT